MTRTLALVNLKGGSSKTTSSAFLAHALAERGRRVVMVDADPQGSALRWQGLAEWPIPVIGLPSTTLHRQLWGVVDREKYDTVVIDTPPMEERDGIVASVLRVATDIVIPLAPTMMELDRIGPVWRALDDSAGHRDDDAGVSVLLTRTVANAGSTDTVRGVLVDQGRRVFSRAVPRREVYAQAFGAPVPVDEAYGAVADELISDWKADR